MQSARHRRATARVAEGVRIGMTLGAALAAVPGIDPQPRDVASESR